MGWTLWDFRHRHTMILKAYINGHENVWKLWKGTQKCVNEFFTNLPPKTWKSMQYNSLLPVQFDIAKAKKKYSIHYLTGQNRGLSGLKIFDWSSWPATCCPLFWELTYALWLTFLNWSQKCDYTFSLNFEPWEGTCDEVSRTFARLFGHFQQIVATFPFQSAWHIPGFKIQSYCWEAVIHVASKTVFIVYCKI